MWNKLGNRMVLNCLRSLKLVVYPDTVMRGDYLVKGKWQQSFLSSHLKETPKQYTEVYYRIFISALIGEIFSMEIFSCPPSWIFVDMHDTSQLGS